MPRVRLPLPPGPLSVKARIAVAIGVLLLLGAAVATVYVLFSTGTKTDRDGNVYVYSAAIASVGAILASTVAVVSAALNIRAQARVEQVKQEAQVARDVWLAGEEQRMAGVKASLEAITQERIVRFKRDLDDATAKRASLEARLEGVLADSVRVYRILEDASEAWNVEVQKQCQSCLDRCEVNALICRGEVEKAFRVFHQQALNVIGHLSAGESAADVWELECKELGTNLRKLHDALRSQLSQASAS